MTYTNLTLEEAIYLMDNSNTQHATAERQQDGRYTVILEDENET